MQAECWFSRSGRRMPSFFKDNLLPFPRPSCWVSIRKWGFYSEITCAHVCAYIHSCMSSHSNAHKYMAIKVIFLARLFMHSGHEKVMHSPWKKKYLVMNADKTTWYICILCCLVDRNQTRKEFLNYIKLIFGSFFFWYKQGLFEFGITWRSAPKTMLHWKVLRQTKNRIFLYKWNWHLVIYFRFWAADFTENFLSPIFFINSQNIIWAKYETTCLFCLFALCCFQRKKFLFIAK